MLAFFAVPAATAVGMVGLPGAATAGDIVDVRDRHRPPRSSRAALHSDRSESPGLVWVTSKEATRLVRAECNDCQRPGIGRSRRCDRRDRRRPRDPDSVGGTLGDERCIASSRDRRGATSDQQVEALPSEPDQREIRHSFGGRVVWLADLDGDISGVLIVIPYPPLSIGIKRRGRTPAGAPAFADLSLDRRADESLRQSGGRTVEPVTEEDF